MKTITMFETYDGQKHPSYEAAQKHLDKKYNDLLYRTGNIIFNFTVDYARTGREKIMEYIDGHLDIFQELKVIKEDMILCENEKN